MSHAPGLDRLTRSVPGEGTKGVTMDAIATAEPFRSCTVTDHPLRSLADAASRSGCIPGLRRSLLLRHPNLQVNMGCFMLPRTCSTCGLHSGSPSNSKTNRGSGSARTVRLSSVAAVLPFPDRFPMEIQPLCSTAGLASAPLRSSAIVAFPSSRPELTPQALPFRPA
uniref:Uncharacterized protein n=1 Tax=Zea mays TaxID=4577 RepID=B6SZ79_MAIZE|nr:hypothetical protein [Zea mays]